MEENKKMPSDRCGNHKSHRAFFTLYYLFAQFTLTSVLPKVSPSTRSAPFPSLCYNRTMNEKESRISKENRMIRKANYELDKENNELKKRIKELEEENKRLDESVRALKDELFKLMVENGELKRRRES